jgi:3-methyladenine DNA glycosylase Tag
MIRIDMTNTNVTDRQAAEFMLDVLELSRKEELVANDIRFKSTAAQAREMIRIKKGREDFSNALKELVEIVARLKSFVSMASDAQIAKLQDETEALKSLAVNMENAENEDCRDNWCTLLTGCESK